MRERPLRRRYCIFKINFMKNLAIFSAVSAALFAATLAPVTDVAQAAVLPKSATRAPDSNSVVAVRALITRCLPGVLGQRNAPTAGLSRASLKVQKQMLGDRDGSVWLDHDADVMMVDFHDAPTCRILALSIKPAVLADLVMRVFAEAETPFTREKFQLREGGGFSAVYSSPAGKTGVVIRISTISTDKGERFATLSVEADQRETVVGNISPRE